MTENTEIFCVPNYVLLCVFSFLSSSDLLKVGQTCKKFNTIKDTNLLWVQFLKNEFKKVLIAKDNYQAWTVSVINEFKEILKVTWGRTHFISWNGDGPWTKSEKDNRKILLIEKNWNNEGIGSTKKQFIQLYKKNQEHLKTSYANCGQFTDIFDMFD